MPPPAPPLAHIVPRSPPTSDTLNKTIPTNPQPSTHLLTPTTNPIPLLPHPTARLYSLLHTALIPALYLLRAPALVADPLRTLTYDLLPIATAQIAFCVVCLPSAGSWDSGTRDGGRILEGSAEPKGGSGGGGATSKGVGNAGNKGSIGRRKGKAIVGGGAGGGGRDGPALKGFWGRVVPALIPLLLTLLLPPIPLTLLLLVLGAPLLPPHLLPHTLALSTHLSLLIFLPLFYTHGVSSTAWRDIAAAWLPFDPSGVWGGAVGCVVGGWLGAVPIALDWDRKWQEWPCTVLWGSVMGWAVGRVVTAAVGLGVGRRIDLGEAVEIPPDVVGVEAAGEGKKTQ